MNYPIIRVADFDIIKPCTLRIRFDDGTQQTIDFEPVLYGYYCGPLRNPTFFQQVRLDPEVHTLVWPNGADFDPATLYDWHRGDGAELAERAKRRKKIAAPIVAG